MKANFQPGYKSIIITLSLMLTGMSLFSQTRERIVIGQQPVYKIVVADSQASRSGKIIEAIGCCRQVCLLLDAKIEAHSSHLYAAVHGIMLTV